MHTGEFDAPSNPVSLTAVPADGDGHLDYWMGSYFAYGPRDAAELSVILFEDTKLNAVIEGRPGSMGALDLVADFEDFVAEVLPAEDWATLDENGISYDGDLNPVFTGNGMPDVAELGLLNAVLKDTEIDFAARSGVVNQFTWEAWAANLALAEAQLGTAIPTLASKPYLARIVAAYMTLGEYDSVEWINVVMDAYTNQDVLERDAFDRSKQRYFKYKGDTDNDGPWNIEEWQGLTLTGVLLDDIAAYTEAALDPEAQPTAAKMLGGMAKTAGSECPNKACIPPVQVTVYNPNTPPFVNADLWKASANTLIVTRMDTGDTIVPGGSAMVPLGTEIKVQAKPDTGVKYQFSCWAVTGTLIDGSRVPSEKFYVTKNTFILAGFSRSTILVPTNNAYTTYSVGGGLNDGPYPRDAGLTRYYVSPDETATLSGKSTTSSRNAMVIEPGPNTAAPSHSRTNPVQVRSAPYAHIAPISPEEKQDAIGLSSTSGGYCAGSSNPYNVGAVLGSVTSGEHGLVRIDARPFIGFEFVGFDGETGPMFSGYAGGIFYGPTILYRVAGESEEVHGVFKEKEEYTLDLKVAGDDVPCSGYVTAEPAMKYYAEGTVVELSASPHGGCCVGGSLVTKGYELVGWSGEAWGTGGSWATPVPVEWLDSNEIKIAMDHDYTVRAVFRKAKCGAGIFGLNINRADMLTGFFGGPNDRMIKAVAWHESSPNHSDYTGGWVQFNCDGTVVEGTGGYGLMQIQASVWTEVYHWEINDTPVPGSVCEGIGYIGNETYNKDLGTAIFSHYLGLANKAIQDYGPSDAQLFREAYCKWNGGPKDEYWNRDALVETPPRWQANGGVSQGHAGQAGDVFDTQPWLSVTLDCPCGN